MKSLLMTMVLTAYCGVALASQVVSAPVEHLFIPKGFDNNDNVEIFVSGKFPNPCYSRNKVDVKVIEDQIQVTVTALLNNQENKNCEDYQVSFLEDVTIGSLQAGEYKLTVNGKLSEKLIVNEARSTGVDDHLYAEVDYVELGFTGGANGEVFLVGRTADCIVLDRVELISNEKDTLSILPIMKIVSTSCAKQKVQFNIPVKFDPLKFNSSNILLFVKTMDGKSINSLMDR